MKKYSVSWTVDVYADSAEEAAVEGHRLIEKDETPTLWVRGEHGEFRRFDFDKAAVIRQTPGHA